MLESPFHSVLRALSRSKGCSSLLCKQLFLTESPPVPRGSAWPKSSSPLSSPSRGITRNEGAFRTYSKATASDLKILDNQVPQDDSVKTQEEKKQIRTPWHREGSHLPPVEREAVESTNAMRKGKLLTTPSKLLKLVLPLTPLNENTGGRDVEPLALLVHPQQPLSYLERLIQSELPLIKNDKGEEKIPAVYFRAEDSSQEDAAPMAKRNAEKSKGDGLEEMRFEGKVEKTGIINPKAKKVEEEQSKQDDGDGPKMVRWSTSTEIGDFIRDAARGKEFSVEIEGAARHIRVQVPSFQERTYYLRMRLRKTARKMITMAEVKQECDTIAQRGAQRVAFGGFGVLVSWWYIVYRLTFETELGWDTMEPVTYLVGLSTLIAGYCWFLYHNREVSYRSALEFTISRRQSKLYQAKGFDLAKWEALVEEGNQLRKEIKAIAEEYDEDWDEKVDEQDEKVSRALKEHRDEKKDKAEDKEDDNAKGD